MDSKALEEFLTASDLHVVVDSRSVEPGSIFVALPGARTDGHLYVDEAFKQGAKLAVVERPGRYSGPVLMVENTRDFLLTAGRKKLRLGSPFVIAITGSNGKTTTKELISRFLEASGKRAFKTRANYNTDVGVPLSILNQYRGEEIAVLEFGVSQPGDMDKLCSVTEPDIGIVLRVGSAHVGNFPSKEALLEEKLSLLRKARRSLMHTSLKKYVEQTDVTFGPGGDVELMEREWKGYATAFKVRIFGSVVQAEVPAVWHGGMLENLTAAIAVVRMMGLNPDLQVLETFSFPPRRFQLRRFGGISVVDDTYNSSVESVEVAVECLRAISDGRLYAVVGVILEQGWNSQRTHARLGKLLQEAFDGVLVYGLPTDSNVHELAENAGHKLLGVFDSGEMLVRRLLEVVRSKDLVYFKASRGVKLDEVVDLFMAELMRS